MRKSSVLPGMRMLAAFAVPALCLAVTTQSWLTSTYTDFTKGELRGVSLRSDGRITLAPASQELFDSSLAYLWSIVRDSHGVIYAAGGPGARVYRFKPNGQPGGQHSGQPSGAPEKVAEFDAIEVHALAIDRQDRVYAATFPDGRIYRLGAKPEPFYDPKQKYIWAMAFNEAGDLFVATGEHGEIHRVSPGGQGSVFFRAEDTHVRALAFCGPDLIAGTDPTGLVLRIDPQGRAFVLYQLPKREVTAVAIAPDGAIYAAGAGTQQTASTASALLTAITAPGAPPAPNPAAAPRSIALTGGSELYRIESSGFPQKVWSHPQDVVYSIAFDRTGLPLLATGNKGTIYLVDSPSLYTALEVLNANQVTALLPANDGSFLAATGNLGKVFQLGPQLETKGTVTSEVFDSGSFSTWGRLTPYGEIPVNSVQLEAHSGNVDRPRDYWSNWTAGAPPAARFLQWRATLTASVTAAGSAPVMPVLDSVEQAYKSRNAAPRIEEIEATPPNYKFPAPVLPVLLQRVPATINLPAMGKRPAAVIPSAEGDPSTMTAAKGWIGIRWTAADENSDPLIYTLQIRGVHESGWKPLRDNLIERHFTFDSTAYADGEYRVRVIASDQPGNPAGQALSGQLDSSPILIDNTPPVISALTAQRNGTGLRVTWNARDEQSVIRRAEYALDGQDWTLVDPTTGLSDAQTLAYAHSIPVASAGEHTVAVRVTDDYDNAAIAKVVVP